VCGEHFNEVISLQNHTFPIKTMETGKKIQYNSPINAGENPLVTGRDVKLQSIFESKRYERHI
jgi:hypothetical protein